MLLMVFPFTFLIGCTSEIRDQGPSEEGEQAEEPKEEQKPEEIVEEPTPEPEPEALPPAIPVKIDRSVKYQEIEGFGFFGAKDVWWSSSDPNHFYDDEWLTQIIDDLGITMWRNELYPNNPVDSDRSTEKQDTNWAVQEPMIRALKAKADEYHVPLKVILTVWSPPGEFKVQATMGWAGDQKAQRGGAHNSTKNGGTLDPEKYTDYAEWLKDGLGLYKKIGIDVYALSLQNEPAFKQYFNSCTYTTRWYCELLKNVVPKVKEGFPDVKIFGSEHMLKNEGAEEDYQWFYHTAIKGDQEALKNLDVFAVHGYTNGVLAEAIANHKDYWTRTREQFSDPTGKPYWMTETSGYADAWIGMGGKPGALDLAVAIHSALYHGRASAWVWWQGSNLSRIDDYCLMKGTEAGKKYYVSKHYYRFVRPGSRMVDLQLEDAEVLAAAFENESLDNFVVVLINTSFDTKLVRLDGERIPDSFEYYRTSAKADENCSFLGTAEKDSIVLPPKSVVTLVNGRYKE